MSIWNAIILGLVQGIAEFLPISSSGHLSILQNLFHMSTTENGHLFFGCSAASGHAHFHLYRLLAGHCGHGA
mgnify:CR=1 FL=1